MALLRDIIFKRAPTILELIDVEKSKLNLKGVQKVLIRFDPFRDDAKGIREFTHSFYAQGSFQLNPKCIIKTEIITDRSEHTIKFDTIDGKKFIFKCANLKCLEIFKLMNEHLTPLAPQEEELKTTPLTMKKGKRK